MAVPSQAPAVSSTAVPNSTPSEIEKKTSNIIDNRITSTPKLKFHLLTAYSDNYAKIGDLCAKVNEKYAEKHENCIFEAVVELVQNVVGLSHLLDVAFSLHELVREGSHEVFGLGQRLDSIRDAVDLLVVHIKLFQQRD